MRQAPLHSWLWSRDIAAILCVLLFSISAMPSPAVAAPDTIYLNGQIITVDAKDSIAEAVAIKDGKIQAVGQNQTIQALADSRTRIIDLGGKTMIPGIFDAHSHFPLSANTALFQVDLNSPPIGKVKGMDDLIARLKEKAASTPKGQWVVGVGYDDSLLAEKRHPTRQDLDKVSTEHPIAIMHVSYHFAAFNSKALQVANITKETPEPTGGKIRRDLTTGEPNGVFEELPAFGQVLAHIPPRTEEEYLELIQYAGQEYAAQGVTTAQHGFLADQSGLISDPALMPAFERAIREGRLTIRVVVWPGVKYAHMLAAGQVPAPSLDSSWLKMGATKTIADGSIQGYTGYLSKPYHVQAPGHKEDYRGYLVIPREQLAEQMMAEHQAGRQLAIHGNGDAAIDNILYAVEQAQKAHPRSDARHIVVHAQMTREDQLDKMKELGVTPSFFVLHTYYWGDRHHDLFLGPERAMRISPAQSALQRGLRFTIHADTPVVPMEPFRLMWSAVNRVTTSGKVLGEAQRLSPMQALRAMTIDAAWQAFEEDTRGSIEPGKFADLVILSANPLTDPMKIKDITVLETIVGGKTIYAAQ